MKHLVDHLEPVPFSCADCVHVDPNNVCRCKAFDLIPIGIYGEDHKKVINGQKGDYVFETNKERQYDNVYVFEECGD